jgi:small-conductance mechanosensitive channel
MDFGATILHLVESFFDFLGIQASDIIIQTVTAIAVIIAFLFIGWIVYSIFERFFCRWAERTKTNLDDEILKNIKKPIYFFVLLIGVYTAIRAITLFDEFETNISYVFIFAEIFLVTFIITRVVNVVIAWYAEKQKKKGVSEHILFVLKKIINALILLFAFLFILYVFEINLSGVVVGLGVGGIAIAFALQSVLSDLFSAFSIYFDKPFEIGDFIVIGDNSGVVQKIGMKSTRVQLLQGEELVVANTVLTTTNVRNFKKMKKRRITFSFGVVYATPVEKLRKIPGMVKTIIEKNKLTNVDRVHFKEFGNFSLNFEVVYYINSNDYAKYMDIQQDINLGIMEAFQKENIEMAFPTQTIFLSKEDN